MVNPQYVTFGKCFFDTFCFNEEDVKDLHKIRELWNKGALIMDTKVGLMACRTVEDAAEFFAKTPECAHLRAKHDAEVEDAREITVQDAREKLKEANKARRDNLELLQISHKWKRFEQELELDAKTLILE